jgi:flavin reductase (DIM6/NTAB) family NADH-FMN oxidoreductase RutF
MAWKLTKSELESRAEEQARALEEANLQLEAKEAHCQQLQVISFKQHHIIPHRLTSVDHGNSTEDGEASTHITRFLTLVVIMITVE